MYLLLFALLSLAEAQTPKIPKTQFDLPGLPISVGAGIDDKIPKGIIKFQKPDLTAWGATNFRGKWEGGLGVRTGNWDLGGQGSINSGGRWGATVGASRGNWDFSAFGRNAGRGVEVGAGVKFRFGGSSRRRGGGGGGGRHRLEKLTLQEVSRSDRMQ
ncbi:uncharacterized protein LOC134280084 [Saccostrea cucullata]|uniref:uncharacterized protein LOC134280084 n=1 Tax=Saccostrea cuccullata TaxID=36930 RepID=UPI002ED38906